MILSEVHLLAWPWKKTLFTRASRGAQSSLSRTQADPELVPCLTGTWSELGPGLLSTSDPVQPQARFGFSVRPGSPLIVSSRGRKTNSQTRLKAPEEKAAEDARGLTQRPRGGGKRRLGLSRYQGCLLLTPGAQGVSFSFLFSCHYQDC